MTSLSLSDQDIIERYTDQPSVLPSALRSLAISAVSAAFPADPERDTALDATIEHYALVDLGEQLELSRSWLVLFRSAIVFVSETGLQPKVQARASVTEAKVTTGLSCNVLRIYAGAGNPPVFELRFSHRQRRCIENLVFLLDEGREGRHVETRDPDKHYAECVARPIRDAQALVSANRLAVVWRLLGYLKPYRRKVALGMCAAGCITLLSLVPPALTGRLIDRVIRPVQAGEIGAEQVSTLAWLFVLGLGLVHVFAQLCVWVRLKLMATLGELVARDLRAALYSHLQKLSMSFYSRKKTGSLITRVSSDTDRLWEFLAFGVVEVTLSLVTLVALAGVLTYIDLRLGLIVALPVPIFCAVIHFHGNRMNRLFLRAWRKWSRLTDLLSDTIPGVRVVKAFNQEEREQTRFHERNMDAVDEFTRIHAAWTGFWPRLMLAVQSTIVCVWVLALPRLLGTSTALGPSLSLGSFVSFLLYTTMFVHPIEIIGQMARIMHRATSSAHRVFEVLDAVPEVLDVENPTRLQPVLGALEFENVTFAYDGVRQVVKGMSFKVEPGELIGLVGPSGGGKTTLINLITRFYDVTGGRILVDGVDLRTLDSGHYREQVGIVLQEPYLFHGTVLENIRYGKPEATFEEVLEAARAANVHEFVCKLAYGYDTVVGERGQTLSGGERQRVSIARAVLKNPRILILDEATSSVDTETERKIQEALDRLVKGRTVFAIAHRLSTLRRASRLFVIENGRLVECGTHAELLEKPNGIYKKLYQLQQELHEAA